MKNLINFKTLLILLTLLVLSESCATRSCRGTGRQKVTLYRNGF